MKLHSIKKKTLTFVLAMSLCAGGSFTVLAAEESAAEVQEEQEPVGMAEEPAPAPVVEEPAPAPAAEEAAPAIMYASKFRAERAILPYFEKFMNIFTPLFLSFFQLAPK